MKSLSTAGCKKLRINRCLKAAAFIKSGDFIKIMELQKVLENIYPSPCPPIKSTKCLFIHQTGLWNKKLFSKPQIMESKHKRPVNVKFARDK